MPENLMQNTTELDALLAKAASLPNSADHIKKAGDTMAGALVAQNNTNYTTKQVRNVFLIADGETLPTGANGDICLVYIP